MVENETLEQVRSFSTDSASPAYRLELGSGGCSPKQSGHLLVFGLRFSSFLLPGLQHFVKGTRFVPGYNHMLAKTQ